MCQLLVVVVLNLTVFTPANKNILVKLISTLAEVGNFVEQSELFLLQLGHIDNYKYIYSNQCNYICLLIISNVVQLLFIIWSITVIVIGAS